ncbi:MAG: transglycosylase family protein [Candidatus Saccharimonadales bacterium]
MSLRPNNLGRESSRAALVGVGLLSLVNYAGNDSLRPENVNYQANPEPHVVHIGSMALDASTTPHALKVVKDSHHSNVTHPKHLTKAQIAAREVSPAEFAAWSKVNVCEEGGNWHVRGSTYAGGLGISVVNWHAYGGDYYTASEADATPAEQIEIAEKIQPNPPDQHGCGNGW